jgi:hypothetical protein
VVERVDDLNPKLDDRQCDQVELQPGMSRLTRRHGFRFCDSSTPKKCPVSQRRGGHTVGSVRRITVAKKKAAKKAKKAKKASKKKKK